MGAHSAFYSVAYPSRVTWEIVCCFGNSSTNKWINGSRKSDLERSCILRILATFYSIVVQPTGRLYDSIVTSEALQGFMSLYLVLFWKIVV